MGSIVSGYKNRSYGRQAVLMDGPFGKGYYSIVYAVEAVGADLFKIGRTTDLERRFRNLETMSPIPLRLAGRVWLPAEAECCIHKYIEDFRSHGEWFRSSDKVLEIVKLIADKKVMSLCKLTGHSVDIPDWLTKYVTLPEDCDQSFSTV
jgi:hypothetical protein